MSDDLRSRVEQTSDELWAAALDAQGRDWAGERPDPVGFARLALVAWTLNPIVTGGGPRESRRDWPMLIAPAAAGFVTTLAVLLLAHRPAALPALLVAIAAGPLAALSTSMVIFRVRRRLARRARAERATADDPGFYAGLFQRFDEIAAEADAQADESASAGIRYARLWLEMSELG
jgi:hypothetical protein